MLNLEIDMVYHERLSLLLLFTCCMACTTITTEVVDTFDFGDKELQLVKHTSGKPGPLYFNMHDNESTGVEAARTLVGRKGGALYELVHTGERNVLFCLDTMALEIDPNRIYTDTGVWLEVKRAALIDRAEVRDSGAFRVIRAFGDTLLALMDIDSYDLVITLHNNTDCRYCLYSYTEGGPYEEDALRTFSGRHKDPDDFYFVTTDDHFEQLIRSGFHVVQQNNDRVTDDGSLSVYCGNRGIGYINVEAEHGSVRTQRRMIRRMLRILGSL